MSNIWEHAARADTLIQRVFQQAGAELTTDQILQMAQVEATLALAHAIRERNGEER